MTIFLDRTSKRPLYEQLYRAIRSMIEEGTLGGGEKMPSKRRLAPSLGIGQVTVENAYAQLVAEGYLRPVPKSGYYVEPLSRSFPPKASEPLAEDPQPLRMAFDFRTNVIDADLFPRDAWWKGSREVMSRWDADLFNVMDPQGSFAFRNAISRSLALHRGIQADPSRIVIGSGTEALLGLVVRLLGKDRVVALENPGYGKVARTFQGLGIPVVPVGLDEQGLRIEELRASQASLVHVTPSHQFPSGVVMPLGRRMALLKWAEEHPDRYVLEDDYDSEFRFSGLPIPALQGLDRADKVLYLNSFSKSLAPSLRIGYLVLPQTLVSSYRETRLAFPCTVPAFDQAVLTAFMEDGGFERHLNRMKGAYKEKRDHLIQLLRNSRLGPLCEIWNHDAGLHFLLRVRNGMSEDALVETAKAAGVHLAGFSDHLLAGDPKAPEATLVIGYSGMKNAEMDRAVQRLETAWAGNGTSTSLHSPTVV